MPRLFVDVDDTLYVCVDCHYCGFELRFGVGTIELAEIIIGAITETNCFCDVCPERENQ